MGAKAPSFVEGDDDMDEEISKVRIATVKVEIADIPKLKSLPQALEADFDKLPPLVKSRVNELLRGDS